MRLYDSDDTEQSKKKPSYSYGSCVRLDKNSLLLLYEKFDK